MYALKGISAWETWEMIWFLRNRKVKIVKVLCSHKRSCSSPPVHTLMSPLLRYMELDGWKRARAHCRSCHCFPVSLKWNTLVLFIICYSIMNVWKVERAAVIYLPGIRAERAVLGKPERVAALLECRKDPLATRLWNKSLFSSLKDGCVHSKFKLHTQAQYLMLLIQQPAQCIQEYREILHGQWAWLMAHIHRSWCIAFWCIHPLMPQNCGKVIEADSSVQSLSSRRPN